MEKQIVLVICLLFSNVSVFGQTTVTEASDPVNLKTAIRLGLENSRMLKKAYLDETSAGFRRNEVRGAGLPQLNAYGDYNHFIDVFPQAVPGGLFGPGEPGSIDVIALGVPHTLRGGVQINQLLFNSSFIIGLKAAKTSEEFYRVMSAQTEEEVIYDIAMNYLGATQIELQKENLLANIDYLTGLEKILRAQYSNDMIRKVDLNRIKVNLSSIGSDLENLEIEIFQRLSYLKLIMGVPIQTPLNLDLATAYSEQIIDSFELLDFDPDMRKDIQVLNIQKTLLEFERKSIKAVNHPSLVAFGDLNRNAFSTEFDFLSQSKVWYQGFMVGLRLEVPIFDGLVTKSKAAQSKVRMSQYQEDRKMAIDAAEMEYSNSTKKYFNSIRTLKALEENLTLSSEILEETKLLYTEGLSPLTDLLEAESFLRQAQNSYNNQLIQIQIAQIEILKSTGRIKSISL
ncbi:TolC family protein [Pararhodonellum marinum]|uniref:TolC family protein n=1 Tax=Pararhodonellum marinum TaxID=2755358 RepID=UPI0018901CF9|nr:TolC family protein [Pararhodonellum marinum]